MTPLDAAIIKFLADQGYTKNWLDTYGLVELLKNSPIEGFAVSHRLSALVDQGYLKYERVLPNDTTLDDIRYQLTEKAIADIKGKEITA